MMYLAVYLRLFPGHTIKYCSGGTTIARDSCSVRTPRTEPKNTKETLPTTTKRYFSVSRPSINTLSLISLIVADIFC